MVVEDEPLLRQLLVDLLTKSGFSVSSASSVAQARKVAWASDPDIALIDIDLGDGPNGIDLSNILIESNKGVAIVFLTHLADPKLIGISKRQMPRNYAYLLKSRVAEPEALVSVIEKALREELDQDLQENLRPEHPFTGLSKAQLEVLRLLASGLSATQIAERRGTSARAVRNIVTRACVAAGIDSSKESNARLVAIREYIRFAGLPSDG